MRMKDQDEKAFNEFENRQLGKKLRDQAIDRTELANAEWVERANSIIHLVASSRDEFTTDAIWEAMGGDVPTEPRAMGAVMRTAAQKGVVERTNRYSQSNRPGCHRRPVAVWRSKLRPRQSE